METCGTEELWTACTLRCILLRSIARGVNSHAIDVLFNCLVSSSFPSPSSYDCTGLVTVQYGQIPLRERYQGVRSRGQYCWGYTLK